MSDEQSKLKHSTRLHKENSAIKRQVNIAKSHGMNVKEPHMFAKHHVMDCGQPNCPLCSSPRRTRNEATIQERRFTQREHISESS